MPRRLGLEELIRARWKINKLLKYGFGSRGIQSFHQTQRSILILSCLTRPSEY